ncbi:hypothetical protein J437_LFUL015016 [Ladona fulva]|uniref:Peroxisomal membrane protein 11B n=1 Tax=Ladona fulva TaxID=123851 RepID=A0A8K0P5A4_LADFU|nr:hypothetical protein J437_LFUL015016 [Ladona fulva]
MELIIRLNNQSSGRDKIARLLQYGSKATCHYLQDRPLDRPTIEKLQNLEYSFSAFRRLLRLGRFLDTLYGALSTIHHSDIIVRITVTLSRISSALSLLADHILWVGRTGFMTVDSNRWNTVSSKYWLYSVVMSLIRDVYEIWRVFSCQGENRSRFPTTSKSSQDGVNSIHSIFPLNTIKTIQMFCVEHQNVAVDTFKNACDIFIPLAALDYVRISPGAIGLLGVASTFAAILQLLDPMKRLTPS